MVKLLQVKFVPLLLIVLVSFNAAFGQGPVSSFNKKIAVREHFLSISDIHFDPFLSCANTKPCPLIEKLQRAPASQWAAILTAGDTSLSHYGEDTNYALLTSALSAAKRVAETQHVKFVLALGDYIGHDYPLYFQRYATDKSPRSYAAFVHKTLQFVASEIKKAFPHSDVYTVVGNNDSYGGDYVTSADPQFFRDMAASWSTLITSASNRAVMQKEFSANGYYALVLPNEVNLRLIVLNTNLFSYKAEGKGIDKRAQAQLVWLHQQLLQAKTNHQKVFIAMHIPEGIDVYASLRVKLFTLMELWKQQYTNQFQSELKQFAPQIGAILAAHLHSDWFQIMTVNQNDEIPVTGTPSISPIFGNNPGFKVYMYSPDTQQLLDFATYYYQLSNQRSWAMEYDFNHIYQTNCPGCPLIKGMELIEETGKLAEHYKTFYSLGTSSQPIVDKWYPYYWCAIRELDAKGYKECVQ